MFSLNNMIWMGIQHFPDFFIITSPQTLSPALPASAARIAAAPHARSVAAARRIGAEWGEQTHDVWEGEVKQRFL